MRKTKLGQELIKGMMEIVAHQEGKITLRTTRLEIPPLPPEFSADEIVRIRLKKLHMSQGAFAKLLGVSSRVIQSWEQGLKKPSGAARRLLQVAAKNPAALMAVADRKRAAND